MSTFARWALLLLACVSLATPLAKATEIAAGAAELKSTLAWVLQDRNFVALMLRRTL